MDKNIKVALISVGFLLLLAAPAFANGIFIQGFGIDSSNYPEGATMTVSGRVINGSVGEGNVSVAISISNSSSIVSTHTTSTDINGTFLTSIPAPPPGSYVITASAIGETTSGLSFTVSGVAELREIRIKFTDSVVGISLSQAHGITGTGIDTSTMKGGNVTINGTVFYFLAERVNGIYSRLYVDNDNNFSIGTTDSDGMSTIGNLVEESKIKLGNDTYSVWYIDPAGNSTILIKQRTSFSISTSTNVTALALNGRGSPVSVNLTYELIADNGTLLDSEVLGVTNIFGYITKPFVTPGTPGVYNVVFNGMSTASFNIETAEIFGDVLSSEGTTKRTFARGDIGMGVAVVRDKATGRAISNASVIARITNPDGVINTYTMVYNNDTGRYNVTIHVSNDGLMGKYNIEYRATLPNGDTIQAYASFAVRGYEIYLKPVSPNKPDVEGFAPNENGFIFISGIDMANGDQANIVGLTDNASRSKYTFRILNDTGRDVTRGWNTMSLTRFFETQSVPPWIRDEIVRKAGRNASVINFTAPSLTGIYYARITLDLNGTVESASTTIGVQTLFVRGEPVDRNGMFTPWISPNTNVTLMIRAFDPAGRQELPAANITDVGLTEVWSEGADDTVTNSMRNVQLVSISTWGTEQKGIKFFVNESFTGFHRVKFWINATVGGTTTIAIGEGWFEIRLLEVFAFPENYRSFGSGGPINLTVQVRDSSRNPVGGAVVAVSEIHSGRDYGLVDYNTSSASATTNSTTGSATLSILPSNGSYFRSGFYNVRVRVTAEVQGQQITDYGYGWFEVRTFIFNAYSTTWESGLNKPINFSLNVRDSQWNPIQANVNLTKIVSWGSWEAPQPPAIYNSTRVNVGAVSGDSQWTYARGIDKGGNFELIFEASNPNGTEEASAWVHITPFVAWAHGWDWNNRYGIGDMTVVVEAMDSWAFWGGGGNPHNISKVNITRVTREGRWDTPYKTGVDMDAITTVRPIESGKVNVTVNTTGWDQGAYFMDMKVTDAGGNEVFTSFWFQLKIANVGITEPFQIGIPSSRFWTNKTSISVTTDISNMTWWTASDKGNVTQGKVGGKRFGSNVELVNGSNNPFFDWSTSDTIEMFAVDTLNRTVYIGFGQPLHDFTYGFNTSTGCDVCNLSARQNFTTPYGRIWRIASVGTDGTVELEGVNALTNGIIISPSIMAMSKSGKFIGDTFSDNSWQEIDLDGDGSYWDWQHDRYGVLMIDARTAGKYNTILVNKFINNTLNFTSGYKNASSGGGVQFGGAPIYLIDSKYRDNFYTVRFSSGRMGWDGMHLGTFANGSTIRVPFKVTTANGIPIPNASVSIDGFATFRPEPMTPITSAVKTTDARGIALVELDSSTLGLETGEYLIHYNVTLPTGTSISPIEEQKWSMPRLELRNFIANGELGIPGTIQLQRIRNGENMIVGQGSEIEFGGGVDAWRDWTDPNRYSLGWPFHRWVYNRTNNTFYYRQGGNLTGPYPYVNHSGIEVNSPRFNLTLAKQSGDTITLRGLHNKTTFADFWVMDIDRFNAPGPAGHAVNVSINLSYRPWSWTLEDPRQPWRQPWKWFANVGDQQWIGPMNVNLTSVDSANATVVLTLYPYEQPGDHLLFTSRVYSMGNLMDGNVSNGELQNYRGSVNTITSPGGKVFNIYGYEDVAPTSADLIPWGYQPTMDRVLVENTTSQAKNIYRIGEPIPEIDNYYAAVASTWGGRIVLVNSSIDAPVYPLPEWAPDGDVYYVGRFSDENISMDINRDNNITGDMRYYIMLEDQLPNGENSPNAAIYDDDRDLYDQCSWGGSTPICYDLYTNESGYNDYRDWYGLTNMSEQTLWDIGRGNLWGWPFAMPKVSINETTGRATATTFQSKNFYNKNEMVKIYVTASDFEGIPIEGNASVRRLTLVDGGGMRGPIEGLPKRLNVSGTRTSIRGGDALISINLSSDVQDPEGILSNLSFGHFLAKVRIESTGGQVEVLDKDFMVQGEMPRYEPGIPSVGGGGGGGYLPPGGNETPPPGGNQTPPPGENGTGSLIRNPGFEHVINGNPLNWTLGANTTWSNNIGYNNSAGISVYYQGPITDIFASQNIIAPELNIGGRNLNFSVHIKRNIDPTIGNISFRLNYTTTGGTGSRILSFNPPNDVLWHEYKGVYIFPAEALSLTKVEMIYTGTNGTHYIDDVILEPPFIGGGNGTGSNQTIMSFVKNPGFELAVNSVPTNWTLAANVTWANNIGYNNSAGISAHIPGTNNLIASQNMTLQFPLGGMHSNFSVHLKRETGFPESGNISFRINYGRSGGIAGSSVLDFNPPNDNTWGEYKGVYNFPPDALSMQNVEIIDMGTGTHYIDDVILEPPTGGSGIPTT